MAPLPAEARQTREIRAKVAPILKLTYGEGVMVDALADELAKKLAAWPDCDQPRYGAETREDMTRLMCWDWFSGGGTAEGVARKIEVALS